LTHGDPVSGAADAPFAADVPNEAPLVAPADPIIARALDEAFSERDPARPRNTLAMVVMRDGQVVAERYAPGYDLNTPIWAHSITKSVTHALIGALIQQGRARLDQTVELKSAKAPAEHATLDALLRMTSGLPFDETGGVVNPMTRLFFLERDMAEFAASTAPVTHPGREWGYSNLGYLLLGRVVRDANSDPTQLSEDFIRETLFVPLHMNHSLIETDVTDTPVAASHLYTTARDLAKFGQLYLDDGVVDGRRVLPEGWVQQARTRTLNTGYGAGFWLNHRQSGTVPVWDAPWGMPTLPEDMFYARGAFGQYVIIVPSQRLVVVRLGFTPDYRTGIEEAVAKIISAFAARPKVHSDST
jgi:hypothetical protein